MVKAFCPKNNVSLVSIQSKQAAVSKFTHITVDLRRKSTEYSGMVKIGNPPQEFEMVFDPALEILSQSSFLANAP